MRPLKIQKKDLSELLIMWNNGHESTYGLEQLRDWCPCAGCKGETVLMQSYVPPPADRSTPGRYILVGIQQVGSYAIQPTWGDGHTTGIYTWEYLVAHCSCQEHASLQAQ